MEERREPAGGRRTWVALLGVATMVLAACTPSGGESPSEPASSEPSESQAAAVLDPIPMRIGALNPQTGALSGIVAALEEALRMGESEINAVSDGLVTIDFADDGTE